MTTESHVKAPKNPPYDPRSVANLILELHQGPISNLKLQKLLYFSHGVFLTRTKTPLVSGYFEAWTHGPVHPAVYNAFKEFGAEPITSNALSKDVRTGELRELGVPDDNQVVRITRSTIDSFSDLSAGQLVRLSHAQNSPWDEVFRRSKSEHMLGLRISNDLILDRFRYHRLTACKLDEVDEPREDTPLAYHRFG